MSYVFWLLTVLTPYSPVIDSKFPNRYLTCSGGLVRRRCARVERVGRADAAGTRPPLQAALSAEEHGFVGWVISLGMPIRSL